MATIKVKFRPSSIPGHEGKIFYQIVHERKARQLHTDYKILPGEWDSNRSIVTMIKGSERTSYIQAIRQSIRADIERIKKIIRKFDSAEITYSADEIIYEFQRYAEQYTLFNFTKTIILQLKQIDLKLK